MDVITGSQQPSRVIARCVQHTISPGIGRPVSDAMERSVHTHTRTQFAEQVFPGGSRHDLPYTEVLPLRVFFLEKRRRDEDFIGHFDFDTCWRQFVDLYFVMYTKLP